VVRRFKLFCLGQDFFGIFVQVNILTQSLLTMLLTLINPIHIVLGHREGGGGGGRKRGRKQALRSEISPETINT